MLLPIYLSAVGTFWFSFKRMWRIPSSAAALRKCLPLKEGSLSLTTVRTRPACLARVRRNAAAVSPLLFSIAWAKTRPDTCSTPR